MKTEHRRSFTLPPRAARSAITKPVNKKLTVKKHRAVCYESSNPKIATVNAKGKVTAKKKGTCYVYAYVQNGVFRKLKVTVY